MSTLPLVREETVIYQCGSEIKTFKCQSALCAYNCFMSYLDLIDYNKKIGERFTARPHLKKWYKQGYLGVLNFMLVNRQVAWNMSYKIP